MDRRLAAIERWVGLGPDLDALDQEIARVRRERVSAIDRHDFDVSVTLRGQEKLYRVCGAEPPWSEPGTDCGNGGQDQNLRKSGWSSCHHTSTTVPIMLEPLIGPQYRLSHESARLSPSM
jgi:hypothetical protein